MIVWINQTITFYDKHSNDIYNKNLILHQVFEYTDNIKLTHLFTLKRAVVFALFTSNEICY